jgi:AraC-like DNA-binding protein
MRRENSELVLDTNALNSDLGMPLIQRVSVVRCHSASRITWHKHEYYELLLLTEGATTYEFQDGTTAELAGGQFLVIPPGTIHRGMNDIRRPALLCGMMLAPNNAHAERYTTFGKSDLKWLKEKLDQESMKPQRMDPELRLLVKQLPNLIATTRLDSQELVLKARLKICQVVFEVAAQLARVASTSSGSLVENAVAFMRTRVNNPTSIRELANRVGCSRAHLFATFKESTGLTPNDFWQRMRLEEAHAQVVNSSESITQIAMNCGFTTLQYFSAVFRKYFGESPTECRRHA